LLLESHSFGVAVDITLVAKTMKYLVEIVFLLLVASPFAIGLERSETGVVVEQKKRY
jgi:D-alanyl-D-alanine dipeptidase